MDANSHITGKPALWKNIRSGMILDTDTKSAGVVDLIKSWLQNCQDSHVPCNIGSSSTLPTRVIDVGSSPDDVRLLITGGVAGRYAALSHCWGGSVTLTTRKSTIEAHRSSIRFGSASQTFADAVEVTRRLGLRYLWYVPSPVTIPERLVDIN